MRLNDFLSEKWSQKYKDSINCNNPKGFSQRAHCDGKKKTNEDINDTNEIIRILAMQREGSSFNDRRLDYLNRIVLKYFDSPINIEKNEAESLDKKLTKISQLANKIDRLEGNVRAGEYQDEGKLSNAEKNYRLAFSDLISTLQQAYKKTNESIIENKEIDAYDSGFKHGYGQEKNNNPFNKNKPEEKKQYWQYETGYSNGEMERLYHKSVGTINEDYDADLPVVMSLIIEALGNDDNWNLDGDVNWDYVASDVWISFGYEEMGYDSEDFNDLYMDAAERVAEKYGTNPPYHSGLAMESDLSETIRKNGSKWTIFSKKGRKLGTYDTKRAAKKRLRQIEIFKHLNEGIDIEELLDNPTPTLEELCEKYNKTMEEVKEVVKQGTLHEMEHTSFVNVAFKIAMDHIDERFDYYDQLEKIEEHRMVWKRTKKGPKLAWRCTSGFRANRTVPDPSDCGKALDISQAMRMKATRRKTATKQARKRKRTMKTDITSRVVRQLNKRIAPKKPKKRKR